MPYEKVTTLSDTQEMVNKTAASGPVVPKGGGGGEVVTAGIQLASAASVDCMLHRQ